MKIQHWKGTNTIGYQWPYQMCMMKILAKLYWIDATHLSRLYLNQITMIPTTVLHNTLITVRLSAAQALFITPITTPLLSRLDFLYRPELTIR